MAKFRILNFDQVFAFKNNLEIIQKSGSMAIATDFSILLGLYLDDDAHHFLDDDNIIAHFGPWWIDGDMSTLKASVDEWGHPNMIYPDFSRLGCRPVVSYSSVSSDCSSLHLNENDVYECTYGEYPQTVVSEEEAKELNDLYLNKKLNLTGKTYTCNSSDDDLEHYYDEYEYQGEKYIRVNGDTNFGILLSNNSPIVNNSSYWIKVEPVEWLVDKSADIMISKKILFSGVPLSRNYYYKGSFKKSLLKKYLNNKFSKDIIPTMVLNESSNKILSLN